TAHRPSAARGTGPTRPRTPYPWRAAHQAGIRHREPLSWLAREFLADECERALQRQFGGVLVVDVLVDVAVERVPAVFVHVHRRIRPRLAMLFHRFGGDRAVVGAEVEDHWRAQRLIEIGDIARAVIAHRG